MEVFVASIISFASFFVLQPIAQRIGLVDKPNERKLHVGSIPLIGGLAFFLATLVTCSLFAIENSFVGFYLFSTLLIVVLGALDDYYDLSVRLRLAAQALIACILIFGVGSYIHVLGNILGFGSIDLYYLGIPLTIIAVIASINAFNMTDGIDGLAGSLALNTFLSIAILFWLADQAEYANLAYILVCSIVPFLLFNLGMVPGPVKKVFMGDAGSMFIGLSVIWLLTLGSQGENPAFRPVTALWIIAVPLMDMTAIIVRRILKGSSPFKPDRDHLHHIFIRAGFSAREALVIIVSIAIGYAGIGIIADYFKVPEWIMFVSFFAMLAIYSAGLQHSWRIIRWINELRNNRYKQQ